MRVRVRLTEHGVELLCSGSAFPTEGDGVGVGEDEGVGEGVGAGEGEGVAVGVTYGTWCRTAVYSGSAFPTVFSSGEFWRKVQS